MSSDYSNLLADGFHTRCIHISGRSENKLSRSIHNDPTLLSPDPTPNTTNGSKIFIPKTPTMGHSSKDWEKLLITDSSSKRAIIVSYGTKIYSPFLITIPPKDECMSLHVPGRWMTTEIW